MTKHDQLRAASPLTSKDLSTTEPRVRRLSDKAVGILAVGLLAAGLGACSSGENSTAAPTPETTVSATETPAPEVDLSQSPAEYLASEERVTELEETLTQLYDSLTDLKEAGGIVTTETASAGREITKAEWTLNGATTRNATVTTIIRGGESRVISALLETINPDSVPMSTSITTWNGEWSTVTTDSSGNPAYADSSTVATTDLFEDVDLAVVVDAKSAAVELQTLAAALDLQQ